MFLRLVIAGFLGLMTASCSASAEKNPTSEALALEAGAEKCLIDVRDHANKYENSKFCGALGALSQKYIDAGGQEANEPVNSQLIGERAAKMAWMARAISASGNPTITLW